MPFSKNKLRFLSDENFPVEIDKIFEKRGYDIKKAKLGFTDKEISELSKLESRIILTFDKHFLNKKLFPPEEHYGIIIIRLSPPYIDTTLSMIDRLFNKITSEEFKGRLFVLSPSRFISYPDNLFL